MTIIVHHLNNSRSQRVLWLLEELEIPYEIRHYQRGADKRAPKELYQVHPLGKSPVITDDNRQGKVIAESGAIVEYLVRNYGQGKAVVKDQERLDEDVFFSHFAEGSLMPALVLKLIFGIIPTQAPFLVKPLVKAICGGVEQAFVNPEVNSKIKFVGDELETRGGGKQWLAGGDKDGNPTAADYQMAFPLEAAVAGRVKDLPQSIKNYVEMIHSRPAYKRALEKGGPYDYAK
ncbi:thioredoxin-like protein [Violaceomyces palustris]|uniref:Thioredoxin-like protein n=1 Tax=Violaceomyces palustris TaxID=1673888 RepID=A0ACD0P0V8_9BASI|nr:thioredoxin-like protein [Violaceomyces palustris]